MRACIHTDLTSLLKENVVWLLAIRDIKMHEELRKHAFN